MTRPGTPFAIAKRLKRLGVDVQWFSLDEPLQFGHLYKGANACRYSVREVANRLAQQRFVICGAFIQMQR